MLEEVARWKKWLEQHQRLVEAMPSLQDVMDTIAQIIMQDTEPDPEGGPGGTRIKKHVARGRCISLKDADMRHGRKSSAKTCNGFREHFVLDLDSRVTREVVVRPANEPEHEAVELLAETTDCFSVFLRRFGQHYAARLNIILLDQAPAHVAQRVPVPENVVLV